MSHPGSGSPSVLIAIPAPDVRALVVQWLRFEGWRPLEGIRSALADQIQQHSPGAVLLDWSRPDADGKKALQEIRECDAALPVILLASPASIPDAIATVREGAYDYLPLPVAKDDVVLTVRRAVESRRLRQEVYALRQQLAESLPQQAAVTEFGPVVTDGSISFKEQIRRSTSKIERAILHQMLQRTGGNKAQAARLLRIDYKTMHTKAKEYGLSPVKNNSGAQESA